MTVSDAPGPRVVGGSGEDLWFLGTLARIKLAGEQTGGRFALWEGVLPRGAAPPLHSHPEDETLYVIDGFLTAWLLDREEVDGTMEIPEWAEKGGEPCGPGTVVFAPGGTPHSFRVESDTARLLFLSTPAGIEEMIRALAEPAQWPWLQPPPDGPRVAADLQAAVEQETGVVRHGPPPPSA